MVEQFGPPPFYVHRLSYRAIVRRHMAHWKNDFARRSTVYASFALAASAIVQFVSTTYATASASNPVTDIVLSNIPVFDVDGAYVYGLIALALFVGLVCFVHPRRIPYTFYSVALFIVIRSFFVSLTHFAPYPLPESPDFNIAITKIFFGGDLFFSGHTGAPFLLALLYFREPLMRYFFLSASVFFAVVVLLGHVHYSIDVAAAYFITYTIYKIAEWMFPRSRALFFSDTVGTPL